MIRNLAEIDGSANAKSKACIIGAGIAGLLLASRLHSYGIRVIVLESGRKETSESLDPLNTVIQLADVYKGATAGRFRGLGGTSTRWGGQLVPMRPEDMAERSYIGIPPWPIQPEALMHHLPEVEDLFCVCNGTYEQDFLRNRRRKNPILSDDPDLRWRFSKVSTFKRRNIATLLNDFIHNNVDTEVWLNATVTEFELNRQTGRVASVTAKDLNGRTLKVEAELFVIAAGAIESTRLLLMLDAANEGQIFDGCYALGRYFHDHISAPVAELVPTDFHRFNYAFGQSFVGTTMRSTRLELTAPAQIRDSVACAYGHVSMQTLQSSGFAMLREFLQSRQMNVARFDVRFLAKVIRLMPYFTAVGIWRFYHKKLYWSRDADFHLHVVVEQAPHSENRILLSTERDAMGAPIAAIEWRKRETELKTFKSYVKHYLSFWEKYGLERIARLRLFAAPEKFNEDMLPRLGAGDIYHPAGSTRMGSNGRDAVVNGDLRVFGIPNLWVASTSTFPSLGAANPTLTLMLLTLRLGCHLSKHR